MIVSAAVKLIPKPPALVESKNILDLLVGLLNESIIFYLSIIPVFPSNLS